MSFSTTSPLLRVRTMTCNVQYIEVFLRTEALEFPSLSLFHLPKKVKSSLLPSSSFWWWQRWCHNMLKLVPFSPLLLACLSPSFACWQQVDLRCMVVMHLLILTCLHRQLFRRRRTKTTRSSTRLWRRNGKKGTKQKYDLKWQHVYLFADCLRLWRTLEWFAQRKATWHDMRCASSNKFDRSNMEEFDISHCSTERLFDVARLSKAPGWRMLVASQFWDPEKRIVLTLTAHSESPSGASWKPQKGNSWKVSVEFCQSFHRWGTNPPKWTVFISRVQIYKNGWCHRIFQLSPASGSVSFWQAWWSLALVYLWLNGIA